jgi:hypothetical protein
MTGLFQSEPDLRPWTATPPLVDIEERNTPASVAAKQSAALKQTGIDQDNAGFACVLWYYAKGYDLCGTKLSPDAERIFGPIFRREPR